MQVVSSTLSGNIRVIVIDNPPVNATSQAVRAGLLQALEQAADDGNTRAVVIACAGATFVAGADIKEFGKPPLDPHLSVVIHAVESSAKPVVAAIHGSALGGGLELALGCHYRVVQAQGRLGLPESTLGIIPGAGGIPRLLRLVGVEKALDMAGTGKPIDAAQALEAGVVDALVQDDVRAAAIAFAQRLIAQGGGVRRTRELPVPATPAGAFEAARARFQASHRGQSAPQVCVDVAARSIASSFEDSVAYGRERFRELVASPQAQALRHAFFAERVATKPAGLPAEDAAPIRKVGVIGAGTMGTGIAMCFLNAGIPVVLVEQNDNVLASSVENIGKTYRNDVVKGRITEEAQRARCDALTPTLQYESLRDCDLVVEAVFEDIEVKRQVLASIEENLRPDALIATNTSFLDVNALAAGLRRPENVVGMHFFSPAHIMKLLENVRGARSSPRALATIQALGKRLGKVAVMVGVSDGFVGNRMLARRTRECYFMLEEGALPEQVDRVLCEFGFPMGQFQLNDLAGLDVAWRNRQSRLDRLSEREAACNILDEIVAAGRLGQKTGAGFYTYDAKRARSVDPAISELIMRNAESRGITRRVISDEEILERCLYAMINEGALILEEGVAARAEDIDTIWLNGYGFPRFRGGPMFHADRIGAARICERIRHYASQAGEQYWTPAPLLLAQARDGGGFYAH
ncbi:3-hydroxyacyl-CoA dehydrogenase NAD-binding domain-containing protein [Achromobacter insolitus]|uniref:3-hydroxyacyl-CoA dehydrogenase NAD-binding domain-containing protein n=1 Tax=Achromobacter insolitus TaxID=217204 RepID=UPI0020A2F776|nr:3-hydroxyacyl-CoA dehydrogenase NAD-binding domain-containing protein [Achromobacter insolitus]MCP1400700.1 3-hydroxyacyl-CoA dehydrogenase [Achromobacter insolitus]